MHHVTCGISSLLHSVNLILFTVLLVHFVLRISPHHSHHFRSHHLSLPLPFTPVLKHCILSCRFTIVVVVITVVVTCCDLHWTSCDYHSLCCCCSQRMQLVMRQVLVSTLNSFSYSCLCIHWVHCLFTRVSPFQWSLVIVSVCEIVLYFTSSVVSVSMSSTGTSGAGKSNYTWCLLWQKWTDFLNFCTIRFPRKRVIFHFHKVV